LIGKKLKCNTAGLAMRKCSVVHSFNIELAPEDLLDTRGR